MICIVNYGVGNLASFVNMYKHIGIKDVKISSDINEIKNANKIILPGVGAFNHGMEHLKSSGLVEVLNQKALVEKIPVLGICLGMQLMTNGSEEGSMPGLGWFDAFTIKFEENSRLKVPHMGWNYIQPKHNEFKFLKNDKRYRFYFVHSYYVKCNNPENVMFESKYGKIFHSAIQKDNIFGMQFHPEKSLHYGMDILNRFAEI